MTNWNPQQREAITATGDLAVVAGAGSGKTLVLIQRLLQLLEERRADFSQIVAITFTKKAAAEMKERLREEINKKLALTPDPYWQSLKEALPGAQISTIHSFCARILREQPHLAKVDPLFEILADDEGQIMLEEAARESLLALAPRKSGLLRLLTAYGRGGVESNLIAFHNQLQSEGLTAQEVWQETKDEEGALFPALMAKAQEVEALGQEIAATSPQSLTPAAQEKHGQFCELWQRHKPIRKGLLAGKLDAKPEDLAEFLECGQLMRKQGSLAELIEELREALAALGELVQELGSYQVIADFCQLQAELEARFTLLKKERSLLDYNDLELLTCRLLEENPILAAEYRQKIRYLLVDEYQDTSRLQEELLSYLHQPGQNYFFMVGDPKQSIYRFRGAEVAVFGETMAKIQKSGGRKVELVENYRTTSSLINLFNDLFPRLFQGEIDYQPLGANREGELAPELLLIFPEEDEAMPEKRQREAAQIAARIEELVLSGEPFVGTKEGQRPCRWGDIAILFRSTSDLNLYQEALAEAGIPNYVLGGSGFYAKQEVQDVLNFLRWLENSKDEIALAGILRSPFFSLSDETLFFLTRGVPLSEGLFAPLPDEIRGQQREAVLTAQGLLREFYTQKNLPLPQLIEYLLEETGYSTIVAADFLGRQKLQNLMKLVELAQRYSDEGLVSADQFLERVEELLAREIKEGEAPLEGEEEDTVKLLTIHKSKGLEYPVVIVPDISRGLMIRNPNFFLLQDGKLALDPDNLKAKPFRYKEFKEREEQAELWESMRVFYVALTRARDLLILSAVAEEPKEGPLDKQNNWLGWLAALWEVETWEETEELPYKGGAIRVRWDLPPAQKQRPTQSEEERVELPLLFPGKVEPTAISPTHPPLSPSAFITYQDCPRRYFYRYRWGIDDTELGFLGEGDVKGIAGWQKGQILHLACEKLEKDSDPELILKKAIEYYQLEPSTALLEELVPLVVRYRENSLFRELEGAKSEWQFAVELGPFVLEGSIDKLLLGTQPLVVDFKSNAVEKVGLSALTEHYRLQLECYGYAVHQVFGAKTVEVALHYLVPDETVRWRLENWEQLERKLLAQARQMVTSEEEEEFALNPKSCRHCNYGRYQLCPGILLGQDSSPMEKSS